MLRCSHTMNTSHPKALSKCGKGQFDAGEGQVLIIFAGVGKDKQQAHKREREREREREMQKTR